jgi:hypothetical protein
MRANFDLEAFEALSPAEQQRQSDECRRRRLCISRQRRRKAKAQFRCPFSGRFEKPLPSDVPVNDQLRQIALHEAAHVIVGCLLGPDRLRGVTIVPRSAALGEAFFSLHRIALSNNAMLQAAHRKRIMVSLAGPIADFATGSAVLSGGDAHCIAIMLSRMRKETNCPIVTGFGIRRLDELGRQAMLDWTQRETGVDAKERARAFSKLVHLAVIGFAASDAERERVIALDFPEGLRTDDRERLNVLIELASETFALLKANWPAVLVIATELLRKHRLNSQEVHELILRSGSGSSLIQIEAIP